MVLNHTNGGARPRQSRYRTMALTRTTGGAHRSQYSANCPKTSPSERGGLCEWTSPRLVGGRTRA